MKFPGVVAEAASLGSSRCLVPSTRQPSTGDALIAGPSAVATPTNPLRPWMRVVLYIAAGYNVLAGLGMICLYHEGYKLLAIPKPEVILPIQLTGLFVLLFGVGYWLVARAPVRNRNLLLLGFLSKSLGPVFALAYVFIGVMPLVLVPILIVSDIAYLPPMAVILVRLYRMGHTGSREAGPMRAGSQAALTPVAHRS
ncbi:MAG: hypothetical protein ACOC46_02130 [Pirellulales bacterium]